MLDAGPRSILAHDFGFFVARPFAGLHGSSVDRASGALTNSGAKDGTFICDGEKTPVIP